MLTKIVCIPTGISLLSQILMKFSWLLLRTLYVHNVLDSKLEGSWVCTNYRENSVQKAKLSKRLIKHNWDYIIVNSLYENYLVSLITWPTRFGKTSSTLIDNIFTNKCNYNAVSVLLITGISDHLPIFYISKSE